jgi:hypothetical protein
MVPIPLRFSGSPWTTTTGRREPGPDRTGAQRLENGNTLICQGRDGRFFEVTPEGEIVWEYWTPYSGTVTLADGSQPRPVRNFTYAVFRATKVPPDHPALAGRRLQPLDPQPPPISREYVEEKTESR